MQFEMIHKIGEQKVNVTFKADIVTLRLINIEKLKETFQRLGGIMQANCSIDFPLCITSEIIEEVIRNTCFVCGELMQDGVALDNTEVCFDDFGNDAGKYGTTCSKIGQPIMKQVRKCISCGHSHT